MLNKGKGKMKADISFENAIEKLAQSEALEIYINSDEVYIPYMLNDAVECYFVIKNCIVKGRWEEIRQNIRCLFSNNENKKVLIIRQNNQNTITIWYDEVECRLTCYQYHEIGHFWVKGQELFRRLVYVAGTIYDKFTYLGEEFCNNDEKDILGLVEFAPFRYWSPIHESLDAYYSDTTQGLRLAKNIAVKLNDKEFNKIVGEYERLGEVDLLSQRRVKSLAKKLQKNKAFYKYVNDKITKASLSYAKRNYSEKQSEIMEKAREEVVKQYEEKGYSGQYPVMNKGKKQVLFYEEHPFVADMFEYTDFGFKIHVIE